MHDVTCAAGKLDCFRPTLMHDLTRGYNGLPANQWWESRYGLLDARSPELERGNPLCGSLSNLVQIVHLEPRQALVAFSQLGLQPKLVKSFVYRSQVSEHKTHGGIVACIRGTNCLFPSATTVSHHCCLRPVALIALRSLRLDPDQKLINCIVLDNSLHRGTHVRRLS